MGPRAGACTPHLSPNMGPTLGSGPLRNVLLFPRTELENRVDLAEAGGGVDVAFVVVSLAAWGNQYRPPPHPPAASVGGRCWKT